MSNIVSISGNWLAYNGKVLDWDSSNPLNLPAYTIRFEFGDASYDPSVSYNVQYRNVSWTRVSSSPNVWDCTNLGNTQYGYPANNWESLFGYQFKLEKGCGATKVLGANTAGVTNMQSLFYVCDALISVPYFDTSSNTSFQSMYSYCSSLATLPSHIDTSGVTHPYAFNSTFSHTAIATSPEFTLPSCVTQLAKTYEYCSNLEYVPYLDTHNVERFFYTFTNCPKLDVGVNGLQSSFDLSSALEFAGVFEECRGLSTLPTLTNCTSSLATVSYAFSYCPNVENNILNTYDTLSSVVTGNSGHDNTFWQCGSNTPSGQAERSQIPTSWGGTMA